MSIIVTPSAGRLTGQRIVHHLIGLTRLTIHIDQILGSVVDEPLTAARRGTIVLRLVTNHLRRTVGHVDGGTVGSTHQGLGLSVLVPVVGHDVGLVKLEVTQVRSAVNPPQLLTIQFVHLNDVILTVGTTTRITGIGIGAVPHLDDQLQFAVAVHISHTGIVGLEGAGERTMVGHNLQIALCPRSNGLTLSLFLTAHHGTHRIFARCAATGISIVRGIQRRSVQLRAVAVDVIRHIIILLTHDTPGTEDARTSLYSHQSAIQLIHRTLGV